MMRLVCLQEDGVGENAEPFSSMGTKGIVGHAVRRGVVSKMADGCAIMATVVVTIFDSVGLTVSEKKNETVYAAAHTAPSPRGPLRPP